MLTVFRLIIIGVQQLILSELSLNLCGDGISQEIIKWLSIFQSSLPFAVLRLLSLFFVLGFIDNLIFL